jgi:hypothetical protein
MKRLFAVTAVLVLAFGLAVWGCGGCGQDPCCCPPVPEIDVEGSGCGNIWIFENLVTQQGSLYEEIGVYGEFMLDKDIFLQPCGAFSEDKYLEVIGSVDYFELITVDQPYYAMSAFVDITATTPDSCKVDEGLIIVKSVDVEQLNFCGDSQAIDMDLWVYGAVTEGTFAAGHSGLSSWGTCPEEGWNVSQDFLYDLSTECGTTEAYVTQFGTLSSDTYYEFTTAATVFADVLDLYVGIYDEAWNP